MSEADKPVKNKPSVVKKSDNKSSVQRKSKPVGKQRAAKVAQKTTASTKSSDSTVENVNKNTAPGKGLHNSTAATATKKKSARKPVSAKQSSGVKAGKSPGKKSTVTAKNLHHNSGDEINDLNSDQVPVHPTRIWPD